MSRGKEFNAKFWCDYKFIMKNIFYLIVIFLFTLTISWFIMGNVVDNLFGYENYTTNKCVYYKELYKWCPN